MRVNQVSRACGRTSRPRQGGVMPAIPIPPGRSILRGLKLVAATAWAAALIVLGVRLWPIDTVLAMCLLAGGQCVVMWLIADDLFPRARWEITAFLKLTAALIFLTHLAALGFLFWSG